MQRLVLVHVIRCRMSFQDFCKYFYILEICHLDPDSITDTTQKFQKREFHGNCRGTTNAFSLYDVLFMCGRDRTLVRAPL